MERVTKEISVLLKEEWMPIPITKGNYSISNTGKIRRTIDMVERKLPISSTGYKVISFYINGKYKNLLVHRLVAQAFIPNFGNKKCVNHKNGIKTDNRIENLEWVTHSENNIHMYKCLGVQGPHTGLLGNKSPFAKKVVRVSQNEIIEYDSIKEAANENKCRPNGISMVLSGQRKTHAGYVWRSPAGIEKALLIVKSRMGWKVNT